MAHRVRLDCSVCRFNSYIYSTRRKLETVLLHLPDRSRIHTTGRLTMLSLASLSRPSVAAICSTRRAVRAHAATKDAPNAAPQTLEELPCTPLTVCQSPYHRKCCSLLFLLCFGYCSDVWCCCALPGLPWLALPPLPTAAMYVLGIYLARWLPQRFERAKICFSVYLILDAKAACQFVPSILLALLNVII